MEFQNGTAEVANSISSIKKTANEFRVCVCVWRSKAMLCNTNVATITMLALPLRMQCIFSVLAYTTHTNTPNYSWKPFIIYKNYFISFIRFVTLLFSNLKSTYFSFGFFSFFARFITKKIQSFWFWPQEIVILRLKQMFSWNKAFLTCTRRMRKATWLGVSEQSPKLVWIISMNYNITNTWAQVQSRYTYTPLRVFFK